MNSRFLFLLAWMHGSEGAENNGTPETKVNKQEDLIKQFKKGNENVFAVEVFAPSQDIANAIGCREAFHDNFTGYDTLSIIMPLAANEKFRKGQKVPCFIVEDDQIIERK
jgi:hypothetical protein